MRGSFIVRFRQLLATSPLGKFLKPRARRGTARPARERWPGYDRIKAWSESCESAKPTEIVTFGIELAGRGTEEDWSHACALLSRTLRTLLRQTDPRFRIVVCGNEMRDIPELADQRVEYLSVKAPPSGAGDKPGNRGADKFRKRFNVGRRFRLAGGGYFMSLDAGDLVHKDLVGMILERRPRFGFLLMTGYALDWANDRIAPIPGAWSVSFNRVCGSSSMVLFQADDLPGMNETPDSRPDILFHDLRDHVDIGVVMEELDRPLERVELPLVVYVVNQPHSSALSGVRTGVRKETVIDNIARHAVKDPAELALIDERFGIDLHRRGG